MLLLIIAGIGLVAGSVYFFNTVSQQQLTTGTRASTSGEVPISCINGQKVNVTVKIVSVDPPQCTNLSKAENGKLVNLPGTDNTTFSTNKHTMTLSLKNNDTVARKVTYGTLENFCPEPRGNYFKTSDGQEFPVCSQNAVYTTKEITLQPGQSQVVSFTTSSTAGEACGSYQNDFFIRAVDDNVSCELSAPHNRFGLNSGCHTGIQCKTPNPPVTKGPVASCASLTVTDGKNTTLTVDAANDAYEIKRTPKPGEVIKLSSTPANNESAFTGYWLKPKGSSGDVCNYWIATIDPSSKYSGPATMEFTMPDWTTGQLTRNDGFKSQCANTKLDFSKGVVIGTNYNIKSNTLQNSANGQWCANKADVPGGPSKVYIGGRETDETCSNVCVVQAFGESKDSIPPSMTLQGPNNACYEENSIITASGNPGDAPTPLTYEVFVVKKNKSQFSQDECPGEVIGAYCLLGRSELTTFNVNTEGLIVGDYEVFAQVTDANKKILCSNDPIKPFETKCARVCN